MQQGVDKQINLGGIVRNTAGSTCPDGEMEEIINLRYKDGSLRPISDNEPVHGLESIDVQYSDIFIHTCSYRHWLGVKDGSLWYFADQDEEDRVTMKEEPVKLCSVIGNPKYTQTGHLITIIDDNSVKYNLYSNGVYTESTIDYNGTPSDESIAPCDIAFRLSEVQNKNNQQLFWAFVGDRVRIENRNGKWKRVAELFNRSKDMENIATAQLNKGRSTLLSEGYPIGGFFITAALKTYDGNYVMQTNPVFLFQGNDYGTTATFYDNFYKRKDENDTKRYSPFWGTMAKRFAEQKRPDFRAHYLWRWETYKNKAGNEWRYDDVTVTSKFNQYIDLYGGKKKVAKNGEIYYEIPHVCDEYNTSAVVQCMNILRGGNHNCPSDDEASWFFIVPGTAQVCNSNGDYIMSNSLIPKIVKPHELPYYWCGTKERNTASGIKEITACFPLNKLQYKIDNVVNINSDLYTSLDIFITQMIEPVYSEEGANLYWALSYFSKSIPLNLNLDRTTYKTFWRDSFPEVPIFQYREKGWETYKEEIESLKSFYLLKSLPISDVKKTNGWIDLEIGKDILNNITTQPELNLDAISRNSFAPQVTYSYNGKLHLANYTENYFFGYPLKYFQDHRRKGNSQYEAKEYTATYATNDYNDDYACASITVKIKEEQNNLYVTRAIPIKSGNAHFFDLFPLFIYPDSRAEEVTFRINKGHEEYKNTFKLKPHAYWNVAYTWLWIYANTHNDAHSTYSFERAVANSSYFKPEKRFMQKFRISELNTSSINRPNYIKVSESNNPLYFPNKNTYQVGNVEILAMSSNTTDLSTGQVGDAPLFVFAKDGIYGLFVDASGQMTYINSRPLSRDVINNQRSAIPTDFGVVFTTDRGLMAINGNQVIEIGEAVEGKYLDFTNSNTFDSLPVAANAINNNMLVELDSYKTDCEFKEYLKEAIIGYNFNEYELWVTNPNKNYSYIYSLKLKCWLKRSMTCTQYINNYPNLYILSNGRITDINRETSSGNETMFLTRPIKFGEQSFKQSYRSIIRGLFDLPERTNSNKYKDIAVTADELKPEIREIELTEGHARTIKVKPFDRKVREIELHTPMLTPIVVRDEAEETITFKPTELQKIAYCSQCTFEPRKTYALFRVITSDPILLPPYKQLDVNAQTDKVLFYVGTPVQYVIINDNISDGHSGIYKYTGDLAYMDYFEFVSQPDGVEKLSNSTDIDTLTFEVNKDDWWAMWNYKTAKLLAHARKGKNAEDPRTFTYSELEKILQDNLVNTVNSFPGETYEEQLEESKKWYVPFHVYNQQIKDWDGWDTSDLGSGQDIISIRTYDSSSSSGEFLFDETLIDIPYEEITFGDVITAKESGTFDVYDVNKYIYGWESEREDGLLIPKRAKDIKGNFYIYISSIDGTSEKGYYHFSESTSFFGYELKDKLSSFSPLAVDGLILKYTDSTSHPATDGQQVDVYLQPENPNTSDGHSIVYERQIINVFNYDMFAANIDNYKKASGMTPDPVELTGGKFYLIERADSGERWQCVPPENITIDFIELINVIDSWEKWHTPEDKVSLFNGMCYSFSYFKIDEEDGDVYIANSISFKRIRTSVDYLVSDIINAADILEKESQTSEEKEKIADYADVPDYSERTITINHGEYVRILPSDYEFKYDAESGDVVTSVLVKNAAQGNYPPIPETADQQGVIENDVLSMANYEKDIRLIDLQGNTHTFRYVGNNEITYQELISNIESGKYDLVQNINDIPLSLKQYECVRLIISYADGSKSKHEFQYLDKTSTITLGDLLKLIDDESPYISAIPDIDLRKTIYIWYRHIIAFTDTDGSQYLFTVSAAGKDHIINFVKNGFYTTYGELKSILEHYDTDMSSTLGYFDGNKIWKKATATASGYRAGIYLFGSYDCRKWKFIGGNEVGDIDGRGSQIPNAVEHIDGKYNTIFRDLGALTERLDCKYFRICFVGNLLPDSSIEYIDMSVESRLLQGKLR